MCTKTWATTLQNVRYEILAQYIETALLQGCIDAWNSLFSIPCYPWCNDPQCSRKESRRGQKQNPNRNTDSITLSRLGPQQAETVPGSPITIINPNALFVALVLQVIKIIYVYPRPPCDPCRHHIPALLSKQNNNNKWRSWRKRKKKKKETKALEIAPRAY